jgi:hypothetical protein
LAFLDYYKLFIGQEKGENTKKAGLSRLLTFGGPKSVNPLGFVGIV